MHHSVPPPTLPPDPDDLYLPAQHLRVGQMASIVWSCMKLASTNTDFAWCTVCRKWYRYRADFNASYIKTLFKHCKTSHIIGPDGKLSSVSSAIPQANAPPTQQSAPAPQPRTLTAEQQQQLQMQMLHRAQEQQRQLRFNAMQQTLQQQQQSLARMQRARVQQQQAEQALQQVQQTQQMSQALGIAPMGVGQRLAQLRAQRQTQQAQQTAAAVAAVAPTSTAPSTYPNLPQNVSAPVPMQWTPASVAEPLQTPVTSVAAPAPPANTTQFSLDQLQQLAQEQIRERERQERLLEEMLQFPGPPQPAQDQARVATADAPTAAVRPSEIPSPNMPASTNPTPPAPHNNKNGSMVQPRPQNGGDVTMTPVAEASGGLPNGRTSSGVGGNTPSATPTPAATAQLDQGGPPLKDVSGTANVAGTAHVTAAANGTAMANAMAQVNISAPPTSSAPPNTSAPPNARTPASVSTPANVSDAPNGPGTLTAPASGQEAAVNVRPASRSATNPQRSGQQQPQVPTGQGASDVQRSYNVSKCELTDQVRKVAERSQNLMFNGLNLYFNNATFKVPSSEEEAFKIMRQGTYDVDNEDMPDTDLYFICWSHTQFFAAQMAALGYLFLSSNLRRRSGQSQPPPVEEWLVLHKYDRVPTPVTPTHPENQPSRAPIDGVEAAGATTAPPPPTPEQAPSTTAAAQNANVPTSRSAIPTSGGASSAARSAAPSPKPFVERPAAAQRTNPIGSHGERSVDPANAMPSSTNVTTRATVPNSSAALRPAASSDVKKEASSHAAKPQTATAPQQLRRAGPSSISAHHGNSASAVTAPTSSTAGRPAPRAPTRAPAPAVSAPTSSAPMLSSARTPPAANAPVATPSAPSGSVFVRAANRPIPRPRVPSTSAPLPTQRPSNPSPKSKAKPKEIPIIDLT